MNRSYYNKFIKGRSKLTKPRNLFDNLDALPTDALDSIISYIQTIDSNRVTTPHLKEQFANMLKFLAIMQTAPYYGFYYRARIIDTEKLSELLNPPKEYVKTYGRCNSIGESVFYCSNCYTTAILEVRPKLNDTITVLCISLDVNDNNINPWPILIPLSPSKTNDNALQYSIKSNMPLIQNKLIKIENLFSDIMTIDVNTQEEWKYKKSIALTKAVFELFKNPKNIGLLYPSKITNYKGINFAINPEWLTLLNKPKYYAFKVKITEYINPFNAKGIITASSSTLDQNGSFIFKKNQNNGLILPLNNFFYKKYDIAFKNEQKEKRLDNNFYRKVYPPPPFFLDPIIDRDKLFI